MAEFGRIVDRALAPLESSVLGRHLVAAETATTMRALLADGRSVDLPVDGETDIAPLVQRAYDQGAEVLRLVSGRTYVWDSPVFLDRGGALSGFVIEGNRARIKLGPHLPRTSWIRDDATRFAVFPNTRRDALANGRVAVGPSTRATGPDHGALRPLTVRDVTIDGNGGNAGFSFANRAGVTFDQVVLWRARVGATWSGYSDANLFLGCYSRYGGKPALQTMVEQTEPGDGLVLIGGKADTPVAFARLKNCRGAVIQGMVTARMVFDECAGIVIQGSHFEGQSSTSPMLTVRNSQVSMTGCTVYETYDPAVGCILVDDAPSDLSCSELTLHDCTAMQLITPKQRATTFSPFVIFGDTRLGTRLLARGLQGRYASTGTPGHWRDTVQPALAAPRSSALTEALGTHAARAAIAAGDFELRRVASSWEVRGPGGPVVSRRQEAPVLATVTNRTNMKDAGLLAEGQRFSYVCAVRDALGNHSTLSAARSATADAGRTIGLQVEVANAPAVVVIWRSGSDAVRSPDRYAVLPARSSLVNLFDTGDRIGGRPWITADVPETSVADANRTRDALLLGGRVVAA